MLDSVASRPLQHCRSLTAIAGIVAGGSDPSDPRGKWRSLERARPSGDLLGIRVLVVEDEFLLGLMAEEELCSVGCEVLGPFTTLSSATEAVRTKEFDVAILDVNLDGEMVYPLADDLAARRIPFLFLTGYASLSIPTRLRSAPRLAKPLQTATLINAIRRLVSQA
jgi:CheY-like chemotaxis protein